MNNKPTFAVSIDTKTLAEVLQAAQVGQVIEYKVLTSAIGRDVQGIARSVLYAAMRRVQREKRFVFGTVPKVGLKLLSDVETVETGSQILRKIRRTARRGAVRMDSGIREFDKMPNEAKTQCLVMQSFLGMVGSISTDSGVKRLTGRVEKAQSSLPLAKTLEAFSG